MKKLLITLLVSTCLASTAWAYETYPTQVVQQPHQQWNFKRLITFTRGETTKVRGQLSSLNLSLPAGHVDVAAYTPDGELLAQTTSQSLSSILTHTLRHRGGRRFSATMPQPLPQGSIVRVAFHQDSPESPESQATTTHNVNLAKY